MKELKEVIEYEEEHGGILLDDNTNKKGSGGSVTASNRGNELYFPCKTLHTLSPHYAMILRKKAHLVIRMLEQRMGQELLLQVITLLIVLK